MKNKNEKVIPIVLIRHAQSQWNKENRFTGWEDPGLTEAGLAEAVEAGDMLRAQGWQFDYAFASRLKRAQQTLAVLQERLGQADLAYEKDWRLNERHYGALQGINKAQMAQVVGDEQVWRWRRGYYDRPEALAPRDPSQPRLNPRYKDVDARLLPSVESLQDTRVRVMDFWCEQVEPRIRQGERLLVSAHGNTLRALLMVLSNMSIREVESFEIPTATPILYTFDEKATSLAWEYIKADSRAAIQATAGRSREHVVRPSGVTLH